METNSPQPGMWQRSTTRHFLRWLFSWPTLRRILIAFACVATLIALFYVVEDWRGKRAWLAFKNRMEARGEHFDLASIVPKPVPPEQNFAMTPLLKPLLDYTRVNGTNVWRDPEGVRRAEAVNVDTVARPGEKSPLRSGRWATGTLTDLGAWQAFYRDNANYPAPAQPGAADDDVLLALSKFDAELAELRAAVARPYSVFPVHYEEGVDVLLKHLAVLRKLALLPSLRAIALLELGRSDAALGDVELVLQMGEALKDEPLFIPQLVRFAILQIALQPVWEGLAQGRWNEAQLAALQGHLERVHPLEGYPVSLRGENTIFVGQTVDSLRTGRYFLRDLGSGGDRQSTWLERFLTRATPDGWFYQNQLVCSRLLLEQYLPAADLQRQCIDLNVLKAGDAAVERLAARRTPYNLIASMLVPACGRVAERFAYAQTTVDLAQVACALERYRLDHGQYPETLDALAPQFIAKLPHDVITCQPLKYRRTDDGRFVLYSVGWNQQDDGGKVVLGKRDGTVQTRTGDWVWQYPPK